MPEYVTLKVHVRNAQNSEIKLNGQDTGSILVEKGTSVFVEVTSDGFAPYKAVTFVTATSLLEVTLQKGGSTGVTEEYVNQKIAEAVTGLEAEIKQSSSSAEQGIEQQEGNYLSLQDQLDVLSKAVQALKTPITEDVDASADFSNPEANIVVDSATVSNAVRNLTAKSLQSDGVEIENARLNVKCSDDVTFTDFGSSGNLPKSTSNAAVSIHNNGDVKISGAEINQTSYNCFEIGLSNDSVPKNVLIDGVNFNSKLANNAITVFAHQKDAIITVSNCHFADVSNCVRISNGTNQPAKIKFINCTCDKWESDPSYAGFLLLQDYTSKTNDEFVSAKRFHNLDIEFINCFGPNGKIEGTAEELCSGENQAYYIYGDKGSPAIPSYGADFYPTLKTV